MILRGSDSCKNKCLIAPFLWSYPDVVIACIEHKVSLEAFRAIEAALVKHDNNMADYSLRLTDHHNCQSFKLFSL